MAVPVSSYALFAYRPVVNARYLHLSSRLLLNRNDGDMRQRVVAQEMTDLDRVDDDLIDATVAHAKDQPGRQAVPRNPARQAAAQRWIVAGRSVRRERPATVDVDCVYTQFSLPFRSRGCMNAIPDHHIAHCVRFCQYQPPVGLLEPASKRWIGNGSIGP